GTPVLLDAGTGVEIVIGDNPLTMLEVNLAFNREATDSLGIRLGAESGITAPEGISQGKSILVNDVQIGTFAYANEIGFGIGFAAGVTKAQVEQLIRALTYSDTSNTTGFRANPGI